MSELSLVGESKPKSAASWELDNGDQGLEFYTRSTDKRGHREEIRVKFPPNVLGQISHLVASGKIAEFRTAGDLIRDAVVRALEWYSANIPGVNTSITTEFYKMDCRLEAYEKQMEFVDQSIRKAQELTQRALKHEDFDGVKELLDQLWESSDALRPALTGRIRDILKTCYKQIEDAERWQKK